MAWYALDLWSRPWRKKPLYHWIKWYKRKLYDDWYNSLSEEDRVIWDKMVEDERKRKERETQDALNIITHMYDMLASKTDGTYLRSPVLFKDILNKTHY